MNFTVARNISKNDEQNFPNPIVMSSNSPKPQIYYYKWQWKAEIDLILEAETS